MESANRHGLDYVIPCYGIIDCATTALRTEMTSERKHDNTLQMYAGMMNSYVNISIVAGHFSWNVWKDLPSYASTIIKKRSSS